MLDTKPFLNSIYQTYNNPGFISTDPIIFPHQYKNKNDIEAIAFISALFAYGNVKQIQKTLHSIFNNFSSSAFVDDLVELSDAELLGRLDKSYYRFYTSNDIFVLFRFLQNLYRKQKNIESVVIGKQKQQSNNVQYYVNLYTNWREFLSQFEMTNGLRFMISDFTKKSANKRILMYFRWMVRRDNIDFGIWENISTESLIFPLDTHTSRILYYLGFSETGLANLSEAIRVTNRLRTIDANDPVRFDFAISRLGILNECPKRKNIEKCTSCKLFDVCQR